MDNDDPAVSSSFLSFCSLRDLRVLRVRLP